MVRVAVALVFSIFLLSVPARTQEPERLALLIGNQGYTAKVGRLKNPHNDVTLIEISLKQLGFKVTVLKDAGYKMMDSALKRYVSEVRRAGRGAISFLYYSGHGVANPETQINYLIPVDVADADDDNIWFESFQQNAIIDLLSKQAANATHYVVFDACRNELKLTGATTKSLGAQKGFVPVTDTSGLLVAYATAPKETASDTGVGGGAYAKVLAEELIKPGIEAVSMFRNVQIRVKQLIGQDPWLSFPSLPPVYLAGKDLTAAAVRDKPASRGAMESMRLCREVEGMTSLPMLGVLERQHKGTAAGDCVAARIEELKEKQVAKATPRPSNANEKSEHTFDGKWEVSGTSENCPLKRWKWKDAMRIRGSQIVARGSVAGRVSGSGSFEFTVPGRDRGVRGTYTGKLQADSGEGTYRFPECTGSLFLKRL